MIHNTESFDSGSASLLTTAVVTYMHGKDNMPNNVDEVQSVVAKVVNMLPKVVEIDDDYDPAVWYERMSDATEGSLASYIAWVTHHEHNISWQQCLWLWMLKNEITFK